MYYIKMKKTCDINSINHIIDIYIIGVGNKMRIIN